VEEEEEELRGVRKSSEEFGGVRRSSEEEFGGVGRIGRLHVCE
jgi:hypothetical protein